MPNHIQNCIVFSGTASEVKKIMKAISSTEGDEKMQIDFNKIIPMPAELNITSGSNVDNAIDILLAEAGDWKGVDQKLSWPVWIKEAGVNPGENIHRAREKMLASMKKKIDEKSMEEGRQALANIIKYGAKSWYEWCYKNWGTKWNAYGQNDDRNTANTIYFQTAWASPVELIQRLSGLFPKVTIQLSYADEDSGYNAGQVTFKDGKITEINQPEGGSKEAYDLYFELHPGREDDYEFRDGKYHYKDEE